MQPTPIQPAVAARLTTLTLFGLQSGQVRWGLAQMGIAPKQLQQVPGLLFFKMLGSGQGLSFSLMPNLRRYGLLCTWASEAAADAFLSGSQFIHTYQQHAQETWTVNLQPIQAHGLWDGQQPFTPLAAQPGTDGPLAVLTRASVNWLRIPAFCRYGLRTSKTLAEAEGLYCSIGLGELPFIRQATFSVWESVEAMKQFAYRDPQHQEVMRRTRAENWYSEELFARFIPISSAGTWNGHDPLAQALPQQAQW
ncbi:DUF3291 domain-containing protein [Pontibacter sp. CAU 1760]